jgi:hypothetical protein
LSQNQPPPEEGNVIQLASKKKDTAEHLNKLAKINLMLDILLKKPAALIAYPPFKDAFLVMCDGEGNRKFLQEFEDGVVRVVTPQFVRSRVARYIYDCLPGKFLTRDQVWLTTKDIDEVVEKWASIVDSLQALPVAFRQKSEPGLTFSRLPFDFAAPLELDACPVSKALLERLGGDNSDALAAWIGSLFDASSDCQQYVWIYGEGGNGKSTLGWLIEKIFGSAYISTYAPSKKDNFWEKSLLGKRIVVFPDCNDYWFVTSGRFKSLTGGDQVKIEGKGKDAYSARLDAKCLFFSNAAPSIKGTAADMRRAIFCRAKPLEEKDRIINFRELLWAEAPVFFGACIGYYQKNCSNNCPIETAKDQVSDLIADNEEWMESLFHTYFTTSPGSKVAGTILKRIYFDERLNNHQICEFKEWMKRNCGVSIKRELEGTQKHTFYNGIARKLSAAELLAKGNI